MKSLIIILAIIILFINQNLICRDNCKSLYICDSLSNPITNAYIEIKHSFWGTTVFHGITNDKGSIDIQIPEGKYDVTISHVKYNQYNGNFYFNEKNNLYKFTLSLCSEFCILEGGIQFSNIPKKGTIEDTYLKFLFVRLFNELYFDYDIDSTGYYKIKLPIGKYRISFNNDLILKEFDFYKNKHIVYNFRIDLLHNPCLIIDPSGFNMIDFKNYENIFEWLQYYPGIVPIK